MVSITLAHQHLVLYDQYISLYDKHFRSAYTAISWNKSVFFYLFFNRSVTALQPRVFIVRGIKFPVSVIIISST